MNKARRKHGVAVAALVPYPVATTPSQRYRIEQWVPYLAEEGISVDFFPFADSAMLELLHQPARRAEKALRGFGRLIKRIPDTWRACNYDVILVHRAICIAGPAWLERAVSLVGPPMIFDFDDAIFLQHTSEANRRIGWLKFAKKTDAISNLSSCVVVGNSFLRDYALQHNSKVTVIPTSVDTDQMHKLGRRPNERIVIGWTGSSTSQAYLEMFAPVLREIANRNEIEIRVHSDRKPVLADVPFVWRPWSAETEAAEIAAFDIGIMPMPDDDWARGKCAMKALLYMSQEIPTVCSAVGANIDVISHGQNGFLATTTEDWVECVGKLVESAELRRELGIAGRKTVEARFSMRRSASLFAKVVYETVGESGKREELNRWEPKNSRSSAR